MITRRTFLSSAAATAGVIAIAPQHIFALEQTESLPLTHANYVDTPELWAADPGTPVPAEPVRGYILGDPELPDVLKIYSDYRCPHCRVFHSEMEGNVITDFVETGKLALELMDFPVVGVPAFDQLHIDVLESVQAAEAAACAAEQDAFLAYRDWLFQGEPQLAPGDFADSKLILAAMDLGLDAEQFVTSLAGKKYEAGIIASVYQGIQAGVQGTPTLILNDGEPFYTPAEGYPALKKLIEDQLG